MTLYTKGIHAGPQSIITHVAVTVSASGLWALREDTSPANQAQSMTLGP